MDNTPSQHCSPLKQNTLAQSKSITSWLESEISKAQRISKSRFQALSPFQKRTIRFVSPQHTK